MGTLLITTKLSTWLVHPILFFLLFLLFVALVCLQYRATSLKISVEVKKLKGLRKTGDACGSTLSGLGW